MDTSDALLLHCRRHSWDFFCSMSYKNTASMVESVRRSMQFRWLREIATMWRVPFKQLGWLIREELGERTGRLHWHALLSGIPPQLVCKASCFAAMAKWEQVGGGMCRIRVFQRHLPGSDYTLKGLEDQQSANAYELGKFTENLSGNESVTLAHCLHRQWLQEFEVNKRRRKARDMRKSPRRDSGPNPRTSRRGFAAPWTPPIPGTELP